MQTSDAVGAAGVQLGPNAHAALALLNKELGLSHGKVQRLMRMLFGLEIGRSTSCRSMLRTGRKLAPAYEQVAEAVRGSPQVVADETGWRVDGRSSWLHAFVGLTETFYTIDPTRSGEPAKKLLGEDWAGVLGHDGWSVYDTFLKARHQQCHAHLLRRCEKLIETACDKAILFPQSVQELLLRGLENRDLFRSGEPKSLGDPGLRIVARGLRQQLQRLTEKTQSHPPNERLAKFLWNHLDSISTYLQIPGVDATNWRGEQAIRPAVVNRKVWGGNRTTEGAKAQSVLMSVFRTCQNRAVDAFEYIRRQLTSNLPIPLPASTR